MPRAAIAGRTGAVQIGVRPEKIRLGTDEPNTLSGTVTESAYIGVSTQYIVDTPAGAVTVYVQNDRPGAHGVSPGDRLTLGLEPGMHLRRRSPGGSLMSEGMSRKVFLGRAAAGGAVLAAPGLFSGPRSQGRPRSPKTITFSNWPLYIDVKKKKRIRRSTSSRRSTTCT